MDEKIIEVFTEIFSIITINIKANLEVDTLLQIITYIPYEDNEEFSHFHLIAKKISAYQGIEYEEKVHRDVYNRCKIK